MYLVDSYIDLKTAIDINIFHLKVHVEAMLKMGWVVKKWNFSF